MLIQVKDTVIRVTQAKTPIQKAVGLMFKREPKRMIFIFDQDSKFHFHTKCMFFPIDIIFINREGLITEIARNVKPWQVVQPTIPYRAVLEMEAGYADRNRLKERRNYIYF